LDPLVDVVAEFGGAVADAVGKDYNLANPRVEKFLRGYASKRIEMINGTTREQLHEALGADDPRAAVREVFRHARDERAKLIAETEVVRASNFAAIDAGKWVKVLDRKRWATRRDKKVRPEHAGMHGQTVGWNEKFRSPYGNTGPGPGSMTGGAATNARCRCSAVPVSQTVVDEFDQDPVVLFDNLRQPFEERLEQHWRQVFKEQEAAVLAELERG
jgi:Phage Mu protein F like protein